MYRFQNSDLYTRREVARLLGVSLPTFAVLLASGRFPLPPLVLGNAHFWFKSEVDAILPKLREKPLKAPCGRKLQKAA